MRWQDMRQSSNVEDRRGIGIGAGGIGIGGVLLALVVSWVTGINPLALLGVMESVQGPGTTQQGRPPPAEDPQAQFVSRVLGDTEDTWGQIFARGNARYQAPRLVLFDDHVQSACGMASSAVGPFYCPPDKRVFLDLAFFDDLTRRFGAPGEFARAYVVAHEVGHHVQTLLGISEKTRQLQARAGSRAEANQLSVRLELQADCFAGVWGHYAAQRGLIDSRDVDSGLRAAAAIGDDRLSSGRVVPDAFTHGSSEQRVRWFRMGLESGNINACDTFAARQL